jgi:D-3-phosphoglycerate dehydrogenase
MKDGIILINTSRGGVIDEEELIKNLDNGKVFSAGLDVFENEPNPNKDLLSHPKIISTPHIGAATNEAQGRIGDEIVKIIIDNFK